MISAFVILTSFLIPALVLAGLALLRSITNAGLALIIISLNLIKEYSSNQDRTIDSHEQLTDLGYLRRYFPDEYVADLAAFRKRLTEGRKLSWRIQLMFFCGILNVSCGVFKIKIQNILLQLKDRRLNR
jgi:hypothetical protein